MSVLYLDATKTTPMSGYCNSLQKRVTRIETYLQEVY